jgi:hypothetical protein
MNKINFWIFLKISLLAVFIIGCSETKKEPDQVFTWSESTNELIEDDLLSWLKTAPFNNEWDPNKGKNKNTIVLKNISQAYPFMEKFKNHDGRLKGVSYGAKRSHFYDSQTVIFEDSQWGGSIVHAQLLYKEQELFIEDSYVAMGNPIFSGTNAVHERYRASLSETNSYIRNKDYKAGLYWVDSNNKSYLMGFYQRGQLVLEFAFPSSHQNMEKTIDQIRRINTRLGLKVKEWWSLNPEKLAINPEPVSFWKDPYLGLYSKMYSPQLELKVVHTAFESIGRHFANKRGFDYVFAYKDQPDSYRITLLLEATVLKRIEYEKNKDMLDYITVNKDKRKVFINEEKKVAKHIEAEYEVYFRDNKILRITTRHPAADNKISNQLKGILENLRIKGMY